MYAKPLFRTMGDRGLLVEVGDGIAPDINAGVQTLLYGLSARQVEGIIDLVPSYRSLLVTFDPLVLERNTLEQIIAAVWDRRSLIELPATRTHEIPVVYGGEHGPDLQWVADYHGTSIESVVQMHTAVIYRVYMIGFTPGYPYMGELLPELDTPRRDTPRTHVPRGSVGIAQRQTGIYPVSSPGGWQIIGWTPVTLFDPGLEPPARLQMGDRVRFLSVGPGDLA
jgi:inhibitor of KinA